MSRKFEKAVENAEATLTDWAKVIEFLQTAEGPDGVRFNQEEVIPGTEVELPWFNERVLTVCGFVAGLNNSAPESDIPIPVDNIINITSTSDTLRTIVLELAVLAEQFISKGLDNLNPENWVIVITGTGQKTNIASHLQSLKKHLETQLKQYITIAPILTAPGFKGFQKALTEFSSIADNIRIHAASIKEAASSASIDSADINALKESSDADRTAIGDALNEVNSTLASVDATNQKSEAQLQIISDIGSKAEALKTKVDQYQASFDSFNEQLADRNKAFTKWTSDVEALFKSLTERDKEIEDTIRRANDMLAGSTNAGLAGTFKDNLEDLDEKLKNSQNEFFIAIWMVFGSALPLTAYVISATIVAVNPELLNAALTPETEGFWANVLQTVKANGLTLSATLALFLIMVPSIWRAKFVAAKYSQLFQLREHYQYKYSIAMSVEGFKKQAPEHEQEIAAETFNRLLFNPAEKLSGTSDTEAHPSPLMNYLMNKLGFNASGKDTGS